MSRLDGLAWTVLAWLAAVAASAFLSSWLFEANFWLAVFVGPALLLVGLILLAVILFARRWKLAVVIVGATILAMLLPLGQLGHWGWARLSLDQHRATYDQVVARAGSLPDDGELNGQAYLIERGPPVRIAFIRAQGMPGGWSAVVHDASGVEPPTTGPDRFLFGDEIRSCIRVDGPWHRCWFD